MDPKDWTVESAVELRDRVASAADRLDSESADVVLFHDGGTSTELFAAFLDLLDEREVDLADPLELLD